MIKQVGADTVAVTKAVRAALDAVVLFVLPGNARSALIVTLTLPLFLMTGIEGRLYRPLALTVVSAMGASLVLALTLVPIRWFTA